MQANYESEDELVDVSIDENYSGSQTKNEDILNESLSGSPRVNFLKLNLLIFQKRTQEHQNTIIIKKKHKIIFV